MKDIVNIAHLVSPTKFYGKEQWILALVKHIDRSRFKSIVISLSKENDSPFLQELRRVDVECETVNHAGRFDPLIFSELRGLLEQHRVHILHTHDYKSDIVGFIAGRNSNVTELSTPHGWSNRRDFKLQIYQLLDRLVLRRFDHVAPLSTQLAESLCRLPSSRVTLIPNFIDLSSLPEPVEYDSRQFCYIGRLINLKRVEDAIKALQYTEDRGIHLSIVGDGGMSNWLQAFASRENVSSRVSFLGFRSDAISILNASAGLVIPSLTEGVSRVAMEAMALGKPVIGTDIPGLRELIENDVTGILVPVKDPQAIARAMDLVADDASYGARVGGAARIYIQRERSASSIVREYERLYASLANRLAQ